MFHQSEIAKDLDTRQQREREPCEGKDGEMATLRSGKTIKSKDAKKCQVVCN